MPIMSIGRLQLISYLARTRAVWQQHWPWLLIVIGIGWLTAALVLRTPSIWAEKYHVYEQTQQALMRQIPATPALGTQAPDTGSEVYLAGRWVGGLVKFGFPLILPFLLILLGTGHYIYWHFARNTLFDSSLKLRFLTILACGFIWFIWFSLASTILYINPTTSKAGLDAALPSLTFGFWMIQILVMHVSVRQREDRQLVQTTREAELAALTAQVNPPFIFNALHYLKAAASTEQLPRTEQSLTQLAGIMQYVLEESRKHLTDVSREIEFIRDYLRLQELRLPQRNTIQIRTDVSWDGKSAPITPLLLNPLIENAFKYGISIQQPCFVRIQLHVADGVLTFTSENSILPRTDLEKGTGLGLANVRKRLQLAYPNLHKLTTTSSPDMYTVILQINLC